MNFRNKILPLNKLQELIIHHKKLNKKIGLCHGTFDLLHPGHLRHFQEAKQMCDVLIVTLTPDRYVVKGEGRPVYQEDLRLEFIASIEYVDYTALNNAPDAIDLLKYLAPNLYFKGPDYRDHAQDPTGKIGKEVAAIQSIGGEVHYTSNSLVFSSSKLLAPYFEVKR